MKKHIAIISVICVVITGVTLAALGSCAGGAQRGGSQLVLWLDNGAWARQAIAEYKKANPDVRIRYQKVGSVDSRPKVTLEGPSGMGPDVFIMVHNNMGTAIMDGICEPFPAELQDLYEDLILEPALKTCVSDGVLYGVPLSTENIAFLYNKNLLGNDPVPTSFEEVIEFAKKWNNPRSRKYAFRWPVENAYFNYFFLTAYGMSLFGPDMDDYRVPGWDSEEAAQGLRFYQSLREIFDVPSGDAYEDNTIGLFARGEVPFTIAGPWSLSDMKRGRLNFGVTKLPTIGGNQPRCFSGAIIAAVSSYSENKEAAFALIEFLAGIEGASIMYQTTSKLPALKDLSNIEGLRNDPHLTGFQEQAPFADPMPVIPEMEEAWEIQKNLFVSVWNKTQTIEAAQETAMEAYDTVLIMSGKQR